MSVRELTAGDIPFIERLEGELEWGLTSVPLEQMLDSAERAFILEEGGPVGVIFTFLYPPSTGFIGKLIVKRSERGKGHGSRLLRHAVDHLFSVGAEEVLLDSVSTAVGFYRRFGFEEVHRVWKLKAPLPLVKEALVGTEALHGGSVDTALLDLDRSMTGVDRTKVLRAMSSHCQARVIRSPGGYLIARRLEAMLLIGPMVGDPETMPSMLAGALSSFDMEEGEVHLSVPYHSRVAVETFHRLGLRPYRCNMRMRLGVPRKGMADLSSVLAIASPAKG